MASNSTLPLVAGAVAVIVLSFGAGLLGGSLGASPDSSQTALPATGGGATQARLDEQDRRIGNLEERMRVVEDTANSALQRAQQIDGLRREIEALKGAGVATVATIDAPVREQAKGEQRTLTPEERSERDQQRAADLRKSMLKIAKRNGAMMLKSDLGRIANGTEQGAKDRFSQVVAQAKIMATLYQLTAAEEETVREILTDEMDASVRDVAPYLAAGLEKADYSQVKPKLTAIWDRRDARMKDVLDEDQYEAYTENQKEWRKIFHSTLDKMDAERLAQR